MDKTKHGLTNISFWLWGSDKFGEEEKKEKERREKEKKKKKEGRREEKEKSRYGIGVWIICIEFVYGKYVFGTLV